MWPQMNCQPMVKKIRKKWTSNISTAFGVILLLGFLGMIDNANSASVQKTESNGSQPAPSSDLTSLKTKLELFQTKYNATLLNSTFLPFTKECSEFFDKSPEKMSYTDRLCITYYDMINRIYQLEEFENTDNVTNILKKYNETSITEHFCNNFPNMIATRLEKQPFAEAKNVTNWLKVNECVLSCIFKDENSKWHILDICKLISGGLSMIVDKSKIETENVSSEAEKKTSIPKNNDDVTNPINDRKKTATNQEPTNADKPIKTQGKTLATHQVQPKIDEPPQSNEEEKPPKDRIAGDGEESEQNNDTKIESEAGNYDTPNNVDTADEPENHIEDGPNETPVEKNSNNLLSPLSANINGFREDNESSFFSYFMFLSFLIILFYVAYHNKSKILALVIEGRRGRTYSSRSGSRRKSHSAEYRKLDCNLEEAIQSGGNKTLSSQIIY